MVPSVATEKKSPVTPPGIDPEAVRLVAQCLNHYATPGHVIQYVTTLNKAKFLFIPKYNNRRTVLAEGESLVVKLSKSAGIGEETCGLLWNESVKHLWGRGCPRPTG